MTDFNPDDAGLAESTNESPDLEEFSGLEEVSDESSADDATSRVPDLGASKLRALLEKSRATAGQGQGQEQDELGAFESEQTDVGAAGPSDLPERTSPSLEFPVVNAGPEVPAPPARPPQQPAAAPPPPRPPQPSGAVPAPAPYNTTSTGSFSGPLPSALQSGGIPAYGTQGHVPLSPSGEFGIVPDIGSQSRDQVAEQATPVSTRKRRLRAVSATVVVGVVAFVLIARLIVDQWVSPQQALVWMAAGTLLPTILVGVLLSWPSRETGSLRDTLTGLIPAIALSLGAITVAGMWSQGPLRASAVRYAPETPALMATILDDPSEEVALAGCERFGSRHEQTDFRTRLFSILTLRPSLAMKCMEKLPEESRVAIAVSLLDRWSRELLANEKEPDEQRLCATAGGLASLPLESASVRGRLLQCTLIAPTEVAQGCCAKSLGATVVDAKQWAKHLRETIPYAQDPLTSTGVFAMAFHQEGLTEPQREFAKQVNFSSPQAQLASLEFACDAVGNGRANVVRHMKAALDGECPLDAGNVPSSEAVWAEICFLTLTEIESDRTRPPVSTMCAMTREVVVGAAVETAQNLIRLGLRKDLEGALSRQINSGYNLLVDSLVDSTDRTKPDFVDPDDVAAAREHARYGENNPRDNSNFKYAAPGDDAFQAFMKAYQAEEPWRDRKQRLAKEKKNKK